MTSNRIMTMYIKLMSMKSYCPLTKIEKGDDENDFLDGLNIQMRVFVFCP
jgi:hypothetical protein